ncbi:GNAT family N-acetyltransferase [Ornithinimicrobium sufpigmenti]|uniref:GNAT family N-acetyltransferase n=1 Tax=Ornithinimicrobium sufpigmenti TaxID=2508882 RepID=UPI001035CB6F|nr:MULTISPECIES: GNAT family protein [unclassified Ornithinimicrobium]
MTGAQDDYRLRPVHATDAQAVLDAFRSAPDMARQGDVTDPKSAEGYVAWLGERSRRSFAICQGDRMVGLVAVGVDEVNRNGWVFYWMHAAHRGQGVTARAVATVADWALQPQPDGGGLERLELGHRVNNPASGRVALAAGFVQEGREREKFLIDGERIDVLTYGRLRFDPGTAASAMPLDVSPAWCLPD